jgi:hypothetical protein
MGGGGAIASDRITLDGRPVGYMFRTRPHHDLDSGWTFLAGEESDDYMAEANNHAICDVNTMTDYDPRDHPTAGCSRWVSLRPYGLGLGPRRAGCTKANSDEPTMTRIQSSLGCTIREDIERRDALDGALICMAAIKREISHCHDQSPTGV